MALIYDIDGYPLLTVASISDIIQYLSIMINDCHKVCQNLHSYKKEVEENRRNLDDPDDILDYIEFFLAAIKSYSNEIERLSINLKSSVTEQHVISLQRLSDDSKDLYLYCNGFRVYHISRTLKEEKLRYLVDRIHSETASLVYGFRMCGRIKMRLEVLVGSKGVQYKDDIHLTQIETTEDSEDFVRNLRVSYEGATEITIKTPQIRSKVFTYDDLGFKDNEVWKAFIYTIKEPPHIYEIGPAHTMKGRKKKRISQYETKRGRLKAINSKLIIFFNNEYRAQLPEDFKLYELCKEEGTGKYKFKFRVSHDHRIDEDYYSTYEKYSEDQLVDEVITLAKKYHATNEQVTMEKLAVASNVAMKKGFLSDDEVSEMFNPDVNKKEYSPDELRGDDLHEE